MNYKHLLLTALLPAAILPSSVIAAETARYIRIELPGNNRILTLAEVEVISGGKNVARSGKTSQSSSNSGDNSAKAIDGNKSPKYTNGGQTHTSESKKAKRNPWWQLDLGKEVSIDKVSIWNRGEGFSKRLDGFTLTLLDSDKKPVFTRKKIAAPAGSIHVTLKGKKGKLAFVGENGKKVEVAQDVEVPDGYRDPKTFTFKKNDTVVIVGNGLADRMQHHGWTETLIQSQAKSLSLSFRNMGVSGDRITKRPRSKGFMPEAQYLRHIKPDVIFAMFGWNESFDVKPSDYQAQLVAMVAKYRAMQPNGKTFPRIVLFSPIAFENLNDPNLPKGAAHNKRLAAITEATRLAAEQAGVTFIDLFHPMLERYSASKAPLTINGIHLNEEGNKHLGEVIASAIAKDKITASPSHAKLRTDVKDKNLHWHHRYRAVDGNDIWGGRSTLSFVNGQTNATVLQKELLMLDVMTANRDQKVWATSNGKTYTVNDANVPKPVPVISNVGGGSRSSNKMKEGNLNYLSGEEGLKKLHHPKDFKVNLFASEKEFPQLVNPVQMQVDAKGRVWAAVWPTYPKWEPKKEMGDALMIFEDTNGDGKADKAKEFAKVHCPLGFEFWNGGVLVTTQPDLIFLKDTDGDDVADVRIVMLQGFGSSDTHHAANNLILGPGGGLYWQSGVFLVHNHEHPWGTSLQAGASAMYRFDPRRHTVAFHAGNSPNPHGISFDYWGYHLANDGTGGRSYQVRPHGKGFRMFPLVKKEVRPVAADAVISSANFPDEMQQDFFVCNTIGYLGLKRYKIHREGFPEKKYKFGELWGTPTEDFLRSDDKNFRPTDAVFGQDGALYVSDWHNVIIGHMQHNIRDPHRDHKHGRIYRMVYTKKPLQKPVKIASASIGELLKNLEHPINGIRHRTRVELSSRPTAEVIAACEKWMANFDGKSEKDAHHLLEALWLHQQHNVRNKKLLEVVLSSPSQHARIAAATVKHHWEVADPAKGAIEIEKEEEFAVTPGGVKKDGPNLTEVRINTVVEKLKFDVKTFSVKAGKKVKLTFVNPDALPHNIVIVKPGTADKVAAAAIAMGADGFKKEFIPKTDDILHHSKMLERRQTEIMEFTAPTKAGTYQFICTFPGHAQIMRGTMIVK
ncbi:MAG: PVC-type heme-binding CxxCH protein [Akkermansiaceae bacterium]